MIVGERTECGRNLARKDTVDNTLFTVFQEGAWSGAGSVTAVSWCTTTTGSSCPQRGYAKSGESVTGITIRLLTWEISGWITQVHKESLTCGHYSCIFAVPFPFS